MNVIRTKQFTKTLNKIRNAATQKKISKQIKKILDNPKTGKPLRHALKGERTVYIKPYRLIYKIDGDTLTFLRFRHRGKAY